MAQSDDYLKIDTVEGEVEAVGFEKQVQVQSWSFGATNHGSAVKGTGLGTGKVSLQDFHFVIINSKASAPILLAVCKGNHIPHAVLTCRKTGGDGEPYTYLKITFGEIVISSYQTGSSGNDPTEQVSFNYTNITYEYFQQKADGSVALTNTIKYDIKKVQGSGA